MLVALAVRPTARDDVGDRPLHLEPPAEGREEVDGPGVRIRFAVVYPVEGKIDQAVEDAVERVEPALPRRATPALRRIDPRLVPSLREEGAEGQRLPTLGVGVEIAEERFLRRAEHRVFPAPRRRRRADLRRLRGPAGRRERDHRTETKSQG